MSIEVIERALQIRLDGIWPYLPTAWENEPFSVPNGSPWQEAVFMPAPPDEPTIGTTHLIFESGILQVKLFFPAGNGTFDARQRVGIIKSYFPRGLSLIQESITVKIEKEPVTHPAMDDSRAGAEWYVIPMSIHYYSHIWS